MTDLPALLERVKAANGPDRELDVAIMAACFDWAKQESPYYAPHCYGDEPIYWHAPQPFYKSPCPKLTASIDAAIALVERKLPGAYWTIWRRLPVEQKLSPELFAALVGLPSERELGEANTAPLALIAALLTALIAKGEQG